MGKEKNKRRELDNEAKVVLKNIRVSPQKLNLVAQMIRKETAVRGVAMNPVDHPHGGGEGRTSGGRHPVTPWGKPTKGYRTRNNKRTDKLIIRRRKV